KLLSAAFIILLTVAFTAGGALAVSFDFAGGFALTDTDGDMFAEKLDLNASWFGKSFIQSADPDGDTALDPGSYVLLSEFTLDKNSYSSGVSYDFADNPYTDGFQVYDSKGELLLRADITLDPVEIKDGTATVNHAFGMNLTDIEVFGSSVILDAFASSSGGSVNFTFNIAGPGFASMIENGGGEGSYSGSAAPAPEPGTFLLLGAGLITAVFCGYRKNRTINF
ncbi:MAG: PEP-CTERM sorting domain-containing protein, partial [Desulfobacterales bacterium]|nr:PEP-CTERM sorting domain-containing protein [Desulfobacterales bacterium]